MSEHDRDASSSRTIRPKDRLRRTTETRDITLEEAKEASRKAIGRYRSVIRELAKR